MVDLLAEYDLYHGLFQHIRCVESEGRKYFTRICEYSISQHPELLEPYIESRPLFLEQLVASYEEKDVSVALCGDAILRACLMRESICETWFNHRPSLVQPFFKYVELPNFDIWTHAFDTLKVRSIKQPPAAVMRCAGCLGLVSDAVCFPPLHCVCVLGLCQLMLTLHPIPASNYLRENYVEVRLRPADTTNTSQSPGPNSIH